MFKRRFLPVFFETTVRPGLRNLLEALPRLFRQVLALLPLAVEQGLKRLRPWERAARFAFLAALAFVLSLLFLLLGLLGRTWGRLALAATALPRLCFLGRADLGFFLSLRWILPRRLGDLFKERLAVKLCPLILKRSLKYLSVWNRPELFAPFSLSRTLFGRPSLAAFGFVVLVVAVVVVVVEVVDVVVLNVARLPSLSSWNDQFLGH